MRENGIFEMVLRGNIDVKRMGDTRVEFYLFIGDAILPYTCVQQLMQPIHEWDESTLPCLTRLMSFS